MRRHFLRESAPLHRSRNTVDGILSVTASLAARANFFPRARKFSGLPLDNACAASPEKISVRHEISTEAVENFWIRQA